jgi:hypothetical protein
MSHIRRVPEAWDDFLSLTDTPSTYTAQGSKFVRVNSGANALEFTDDVVQKSGSTMTGYLTLHADPSSSMHAVTKQYVDGLVQGLDIHTSVRAATTAADADLDLAGIETIDTDVLLVAGDRVLVKNQTDAEDNGIYIVVDPGAWTRATDADSAGDLSGGAFVFVEEGTINADTGWVLTNDGVVDIGTDDQIWTQFAGAGTYTEGAGIVITGMSIAADFEDTDGNIAAVGTQDAGSSDKVARADHVHAHGDQGGGSLHDDATNLVAGFMSATDKDKLDTLPGDGTTTGNTLYWDGSAWSESGVIFNEHANNEVGINTNAPNATLHVNGSISAKVATTAVDYDMTSGTNSDIHTLLCTNTGGGGDITITLPAVASSTDRIYHIKKVGATHADDDVVISGDGNIDGAASYTLNYQYESITLVCNGTNWFIV